MLTQLKVELYRQYKGFYDGYCFQHKEEPPLITYEEWALLDDLLQNLFLIRKGIAAELFKQSALQKLKENCDSAETMELIMKLVQELNAR